MKDEPYNPTLCDNEFRIVKNGEPDWIVPDIGLPPGDQAQRLHVDAAMGRRVSKVRFPPGYIEPKHSHKGWHCVLVQKGRMCVAGQDLRPGDYVFGWDIPHGPFEYPDGCEVYTVSLGEDMHHVWDAEEFYNYQRQWEAETEEGRLASIKFDEWRRLKADELSERKS